MSEHTWCEHGIRDDANCSRCPHPADSAEALLQGALVRGECPTCGEYIERDAESWAAFNNQRFALERLLASLDGADWDQGVFGGRIAGAIVQAYAALQASASPNASEPSPAAEPLRIQRFIAEHRLAGHSPVCSICSAYGAAAEGSEE